MLYRHKSTGAVIDVESTMSGEWQAVKPATAHSAKENGGEKPAGKTPERKTTAKGGKRSGVRKPD